MPPRYPLEVEWGIQLRSIKGISHYITFQVEEDKALYFYFIIYLTTLSLAHMIRGSISWNGRVSEQPNYKDVEGGGIDLLHYYRGIVSGS